MVLTITPSYDDPIGTDSQILEWNIKHFARVSFQIKVLYITGTTGEIRVIEGTRTFKHLIGNSISYITRIVLELYIGSLRCFIGKYLRIRLGWDTCHRC